MAKLSANDKTRQLILMKSISILNISANLQQVDKLDHLLNWSSKLDHLTSRGGLRDEHLTRQGNPPLLSVSFCA